MINGIKIEICIGNIDDAIKASKYPIDRIELNSGLELGGLTPGIADVKLLKELIETPLCCMARCRGGDFNYTDLEFQQIFADAKAMLENGADGIVFGFLNNNNKVDINKTKTMVDLIHSYSAEAVFHKAFDEIDNLDEACQTLIDCGINRILTSGKAQYPDILKGCEILKNLNDKYGDKIELLPGGGVRVDNIQDVIKISNLKQVHMTSKMHHPGGYICLDENQLQEMLKQISLI